MAEIKFTTHRFTARKDLLHFVEANIDSGVYKKIGENPSAWIDELNIVHNLLTRESMVEGIGLHAPPIGDTHFQELGKNVFLYRGEHRRLRGLWLRSESERAPGIAEQHYWSHYQLGSTAQLKINDAFKDIDPTTLLPVNFERTTERVKKAKNVSGEKRPIFRLPIAHDPTTTHIYAKGAYATPAYYTKKPNYRLTSLAQVLKVSSVDEMEQSLKLHAAGIHVPQIVGTYTELSEEFLFVEEIKGPHPDKAERHHKRTIIEQDASMLANMCLAGFRKIGFCDTDDKVFNGTNLYLIDTEELRDFYYPGSPDYREILLRPGDKQLRTFRTRQRQMFAGALRDALFTYREAFIPNSDEQDLYIRTFYATLGWHAPTKKVIDRMMIFPANYTTTDSWISQMSDTD